MAETKHARDITSEGSGEDKEYAYSCSCRTAYTGRLESHAAAVAVDKAHKAAVADGTWQAEQDAKAADLAAKAPLHAAQVEHFEAKEARTSAAFGAKQHGGDVEAARAELEAAKARLEAAEAALAAVQA